MNEFFKFPSTVHLLPPSNFDVRADKVMTKDQRSGFLRHELIVEEKIDGANLGISFDPSGNIQAQNRGEYLVFPARGRWKKLGEWLEPRIDALFDQLTDRFILFGEWCYAQHSVAYERLPDWFLGFDIYDKSEGRFMSCSRRDTICRAMGVSVVPELKRGFFAISDFDELMQRSRYGNQPAEGLYLRTDNEDWIKHRAKLVRQNFVQSIEQHWSRSAITANKLAANIR